jgi:IMP dehydrogenase
MRMLHPSPTHDLTYNDVFMVPNLSAVGFAVSGSISPHPMASAPPSRSWCEHDRRGRGAAWRRWSRRRGGVAVLPQDIPST